MQAEIDRIRNDSTNLNSTSIEQNTNQNHNISSLDILGLPTCDVDSQKLIITSSINGEIIEFALDETNSLNIDSKTGFVHSSVTCTY